jgi:hypothetical protein
MLHNKHSQAKYLMLKLTCNLTKKVTILTSFLGIVILFGFNYVFLVNFAIAEDSELYHVLDNKNIYRTPLALKSFYSSEVVYQTLLLV